MVSGVDGFGIGGAVKFLVRNWPGNCGPGNIGWYVGKIPLFRSGNLL